MNPLLLFAVFAGLYAFLRGRGDSAISAPVDAASGAVDAVAGAVTDAADYVQNVAADVVSSFGTAFDDLIISSATAAGIDPQVLHNLLKAESHFRPEIINGTLQSKAGALGIAQFMPATAKQVLGSTQAALDPSKAIPGAADYLASLIAKTGSLTAGVAAYNWGIGNVQRKGLAHAPAETVAYVKAVTGETI
jgi:soluble lytic murein transglycosylase-like protein